jgi:LPS sulfotransferase NodH
MKPKLSYTIGFTQRTGSTLLCQALGCTGIAGKPGEFLYEKNLPKDYKSSSANFQQYLWNVASAGPFFGADIASTPGAYSR